MERHLKELRLAIEQNVETETLIIRDILFKVFPELEAAFNVGNVITPATPIRSDEGISAPTVSAIPPAEAMADTEDERDEEMSEEELMDYLKSHMPVWSAIDVWDIFRKPKVEELLLKIIADKMPEDMYATTEDSSYVDFIVRLLFSGGYLADHRIPKLDDGSLSRPPPFPHISQRLLRFLNMLALASDNTAKEHGKIFDVESFWTQLRAHFAGEAPAVQTVGKPTASGLVTSARAALASEKDAGVAEKLPAPAATGFDLHAMQARLMGDPGEGELNISAGFVPEVIMPLDDPGRAGGEEPVPVPGTGAMTQLNLRNRIVHARTAINETVEGKRFLRQTKRSSTSITETKERKMQKK